MTRYERKQTQPENPFAALIPDQQIAIIPEFRLESGATLRNVPVAYTTRGRLSPAGDNAMVICHALTGSADVADWWGPLLGGPGRAFDTSRFFVVCMNSLGSPYGTASPVTARDGDWPEDGRGGGDGDGQPESGRRYGPEFPLTTVRDDVQIHRLLLDDLGVRRVAVAVGGSMGGMLVLEWAYFGPDYVHSIVPIATSGQHSAWGISWGEAQRQSIYADPKYDDGYYRLDDPPSAGLGAARMAALLTYRSRNSFESRFGRAVPDASRRQPVRDAAAASRPATPAEAHFRVHNDGHRVQQLSRHSNSNGGAAHPSPPGSDTAATPATPANHEAAPLTSTYFSAQSYLRYQGAKFVSRFDGNCYIAITRKLDTHDVSRGRASTVPAALGLIQQPALVLGIESDGLFTFAEQEELAAHIPRARLERIDSLEGHDAFLLQFEQVNNHILAFLRAVLPEIMNGAEDEGGGDQGGGAAAAESSSVGMVTKSSLFGEAEVEDITAW